MNDQFRQLAEQAGISWQPQPVLGTWTAFDFELEKFAELIVRECADRLRKEVEFGDDQLTNSGVYKLAFMNRAADICEEHFEVKKPTVDTQLRNRSTYFGNNP